MKLGSTVNDVMLSVSFIWYHYHGTQYLTSKSTPVLYIYIYIRLCDQLIVVLFRVTHSVKSHRNLLKYFGSQTLNPKTTGYPSDVFVKWVMLNNLHSTNKSDNCWNWSSRISPRKFLMMYLQSSNPSNHCFDNVLKTGLQTNLFNKNLFGFYSMLPFFVFYTRWLFNYYKMNDGKRLQIASLVMCHHAREFAANLEETQNIEPRISSNVKWKGF